MRPTTTVREKKLLKGILEGLPQGEAARRAGYPAKGSDAQATAVLKRPEIKETLAVMMEKAGLGTMSLLEKHSQLLNATKVISCIAGTDATSQTTDFIEVPDWAARSNGLNMAYKLKGLYQDQTLNVTVETHEQRMKRLLGKAVDD